MSTDTQELSLEALQSRIDDLEETMVEEFRKLNQRIDELERESRRAEEDGRPSGLTLDNYDEEVVEVLKMKDRSEFSRTFLERLYNETGIIRSHTFKKRIQRLERLEVLEKVPNKARWRLIADE